MNLQHLPGSAPRDAELLLATAVAHHRAGRFAEAESLYRRLLAHEPDHVMALHLLGLAAFQAGRLDEAAGLILRALERRPAFPEALVNLALIRKAQGRPDLAAGHYRQALACRPDYPEAHFNLANLLRAEGDPEAAATHYAEALRLRPDFRDALLSLAHCQQELGRREPAVETYRRFFRLEPMPAADLAALGDALKAQGQPLQALACYREAVEREPAPGVYYNLGNTLHDLGEPAAAAACYRQALELKPDFAEALANLGLALEKLDRPEEAAASYRAALAFRPDYPEALYNLGNLLQFGGDLEEALRLYRRALAARPDFAAALVNFGSTLHELGRFDAAIAAYRQAEKIRPGYPEAVWNHALTLLQQGDFEAGWRLYESRWRKSGMPPHGHSQPLWDGSPLASRTILLHCEQGLGDSLQFVRYAAPVKATGATVVLFCPPALAHLLETVPGVDRVVCERELIPPCDCQAPLMSLPRLFGTTLATVPAVVPYLAAEPGLTALWRRRLAVHDGFKVGVVWQGNPRNRFGRSRSFPLAALAPVVAVPGLRLISLQRRDGLDQLAVLPEGMAIAVPPEPVDAGPDAFRDTAAIMGALDLVISADTATAHLAGALGVPVWLALAQVPDWRWLTGRGDSPWYPSSRLYHQISRGDWGGVFAAMADDLRSLVPAG